MNLLGAVGELTGILTGHIIRYVRSVENFPPKKHGGSSFILHFDGGEKTYPTPSVLPFQQGLYTRNSEAQGVEFEQFPPF